MKVWTPPLVWEPHPLPNVQPALERALESWRGTPYESGQRFRGRGADCLGSVCGVLDQMDGRARAAFPQFPHDTAFHSRETAIAALRTLLRLYAPLEKVEPAADELIHSWPGDLVITGFPNGGPGHVEIVGAHRNELWHADRNPFHQGGWSLLKVQELYAVYRLTDAWRWK